MNGNYPSAWLNDYRVQGLEDRELRALIEGMTWCVSNGTDGEILHAHQRVLPRSVTEESIAGLIRAGLMVEIEGGWLLTEYLATQTSRAQIDAAQAARIAKNAKARVKAAPAQISGKTVETQTRQDQTRQDQPRQERNTRYEDASWAEEPTPLPAARF